MLSIVIPIYNQDVRKLVDTLMKQCQKLDINFQILCFDDCSEPKYRKLNKELAFRINVNYTEMAENLGRSRIRNWLGKAAYFDNILFLDGDTVIKNRNFIKTYVDYLPTEHILCGGRNYSLKPPRSKKKLLHWRYGSKRESLPSKKRNKDPYINFHSNNFIIPEKLFKDHLFDENVKGYGYEDLLYAFDLKKSGVNIVHIDNPTLHDGLEVNTMFIKKTKNAIENLAMLYKQKKIPHTRLIKSYEKLKEWDMLKAFQWYYARVSDNIDANLLSDNPSVFKFNLWKLHLFIENMY
ncbi:MAG: glycosyltransferase family 2 protein [Saprospiraceae bacterium]|nr:glycosyltransferase family 2 protein [Saprospiraceae bacterium]